MAPTPFESHKRLFYFLRILMELVPSLLISYSLWTYTSSLWSARAAGSYNAAMMMPYRSHELDKSAWHFAITKGETSADGDVWWQNVDAMDVYTNADLDGIEAGSLTSWPTPKWSQAKGGTWNGDGATDDLWCIVYPAASPLHMSYGPIRTTSGTCSAVPSYVSDWCAQGWNTSIHVGDGDAFPQGDPGWRCLLPNNWPPTSDGRCYSYCLDISGETNHTPPRQTLDILVFIFLPILFDLYVIALWIAGKEIFGAIKGTVPPALKTLYLVLAGGLLFVGVFLIVNTGPMMGVYAPSGYPGAPFAWLICCLFGGIFLSLALEDNFPKINTYLMKAWLKPTMACLGIKSINEFGHAYRGIESINSDVALCFWLVDGYRSNFFVYKRVLLALALVILPVTMAYFKWPLLTTADHGLLQMASPYHPVADHGWRWQLHVHVPWLLTRASPIRAMWQVSMAYFELPDSWAGEYANYNRGIGFLPSTFISSQSTTIYLMISQVLPLCTVFRSCTCPYP